MNKLNNAWDLVLGSQFHDILPGTSTVLAYNYAWNDEFIAMNGFSEVIKNSVSALSHGLNTQVTGKAVVVYNPVAISREDVVTAELSYPKLPANIAVYDKNGTVVPSQIISSKENKLKIVESRLNSKLRKTYFLYGGINRLRSVANLNME